MLSIPSDGQIYSPGRMHINGEQDLYILNKGTTVISKAWGGTGNLHIDGSLNLLPTGCIMMYNGNTAPAGWQLCDGTNNIPDLRGKFILGGNGANTWHQGGEATVTLTEAQMPRHTHGHNIFRSGDDDCGAANTFDCGEGGGPSGVSIYHAGGSQPHNNMPPYYILIYIYKL